MMGLSADPLPLKIPARTTPAPTSSWTPAEERRLLFKVDLLLLPLLTFSYGLQFYDKFVFSSGALFGLLADLQLQTPIPGTTTFSTVRYSTATAAFYWGYIVGVLPIALLLQRLPVAKALSLLIFVWGVIVILTVTVSSYPGAVVQRFFLGLVESAVSPGFVLVSSMWYTRAELPLRLGIWYSATGLFTIVSGLINYGIGSASTSSSSALAPWKYMYLFAGSLTLLWSAVVLLVLPDSPATSHRWFSEHERRILLSRMRGNLMGADSRVIKWSQVREAALDWKVWMMGAMGAAIYVCNGGVTAFGSLIIKSFGYSSLRSIVLQTPGGATTCVSIYLVGWIASHYRNTRCLLLALSCLPVLAGGLIIWLAPWKPPGLPLFGYYLLPIFGAPYVLLLALASNNIAGGTKKAVATGAVFVGYNVGNIVGPYLVNTSQAGEKYRETWIAVCVVMGFTIVASLVLRVAWARENARRDSLPPSSRPNATEEEKEKEKEKEREQEREREVGVETGRTETDFESSAGAEGVMHVERDWTDWDNSGFRYSL